jgi:DNA-binding NarL/FixJ family response regulator
VRIVIADDAALLRDGVARLLTDAGFEVVGTAADADQLIAQVDAARPDAAIVDIRMPPTQTDEGLVAADRIRSAYPGTGVLVLSQYLESRYATRLVEQHPASVGYLLKERVSDVAVLADALHRIADGECVIDPSIVARLMARRRTGPLAALTDREREVLSLMAEGHSNGGICARLFLSPKTVETHIRQIFAKLGIAEVDAYHRRVLAVLAFFRATS